MKSEINNGTTNCNYPILKKFTAPETNNFFIVLFTKECEGVVVYSEHSNWAVGETDDGFIEYQYELFHGSVTLSND